MGCALSEITASDLKSIFDSASIACAVQRMGAEDVCIVDGRVFVTADPERSAFVISFPPAISSTREQALEFCNRFNGLGFTTCRAKIEGKSSFVGRKAGEGDPPPENDWWTIGFEHHHAAFDYEVVDKETILTLFQRFAASLNAGIPRADQDGLFSYLARQ